MKKRAFLSGFSVWHREYITPAEYPCAGFVPTRA